VFTKPVVVVTNNHYCKHATAKTKESAAAEVAETMTAGREFIVISS
jgi:hypothetical protein